MTRSIVIVGAGQAGLQLGIGLLEKGFDVTLLSDRSADEIYHGRLSVTAALFATALSYEAEIGLDLWADEAPLIDGVHIDFCIQPRNLLLTVEGAFGGPCRAVDYRLKTSTWMRELERRGGKLLIRTVTVADLEALAAEHDAVFVATGKEALGSIFPRADSRSLYSRPARHLVAFTLSGLRPWEGIPFLGRRGEPCFSIVIEGIPGTAMDRFQGLRDTGAALAAARAVVAEIAPWETATLAGARLIDERAWSPGSLACAVRRPVATLPSGRAVFGLGDAVTLFDPVTAQGANNAAKMAHGLTEAIAESGGELLDAAWMTGWFEDHWERHVRHMVEFTRIMLEPLNVAGIEVLLAASRSRAVGDPFIAAFDDPADYFPWMADLTEARRFIAERTGRPWLWTAAQARLAVGAGQVARKLGLRSVPATPPPYRGAYPAAGRRPHPAHAAAR
jgi:hypothetical protein